MPEEIIADPRSLKPIQRLYFNKLASGECHPAQYRQNCPARHTGCPASCDGCELKIPDSLLATLILTEEPVQGNEGDIVRLMQMHAETLQAVGEMNKRLDRVASLMAHALGVENG